MPSFDLCSRPYTVDKDRLILLLAKKNIKFFFDHVLSREDLLPSQIHRNLVASL